MPAPLVVEREPELELVGEMLDRVADGRGRLLVVEGEAGIGKTALLAHAAEQAVGRGFRVHGARAGVFERSVGFGMARELFESAVVRAEPERRRTLLSGSAALVAPLLGVWQPAGPVAAASDHAIHHGLYWLLANLAEEGPVLLTLDDAHWCDEPTLGWLLYLARRAETLPVAIVVAVRPGEPDHPGELLDALAAEPVAQSLELRPLSLSGTTTLLETAYGRDVDPKFSAACQEWTGGNPMFVGALASELVAEGIDPLGGAVGGMQSVKPPSIARVTLLRLARMPPDAVALAQALAVLGSGADLRAAAAIAGLDTGDATTAADALVAARLLEADAAPRFTHPLVESVVYEDMPPARRAAAHRQAAELLKAGGAAPERIAAQALRCGPSGDGWVVDALVAGAESELRRASPGTAIALLRRAADEPPSPQARAQVLHMLGLAESVAGDQSAAATLEAALEASSCARERATIALLLGRLLVRAGRNARAVEVMTAASDALDSSDEDLKLQLEATLLTAARLDLRLADTAAERVMALAPALNTDTHGGRLIAAQLSWGATAVGKSLAASVELAHKALAGGALIAESPITPEYYLLPILMLSLCDELEEADGYCLQALALARESGSAPAYAGTACFQSGVAYMRGRLAEAEVLARDALRLAGGSPELVLVAGLAPAYLANVLIERDELDGAIEVLGDISGFEELTHAWAAELLFAAGRARLAERRLGEAADLFLACGRRCLEHHVKNPAWLPWRSQAALALQRLGDETRARELNDEELRRARRFEARRPLGIALRAAGLLDGGDTGIELLRESAEVLASSPAKLDQARTHVALGGALRRAGRRADARDVLTDALELAERCGAMVLASEAAEELKACGARPRSVMRSGIDALTASERRVCEMAASGMTNPEIAQALFVTRATVESHLHSAYRKLDVPGRKGLAEALRTTDYGLRTKSQSSTPSPQSDPSAGRNTAPPRP